jgi:hypothetical protein
VPCLCPLSGGPVQLADDLHVIIFIVVVVVGVSEVGIRRR